LASMGPRLICRGKGRRPSPLEVVNGRFNGAATDLSRKGHTQGRLEINEAGFNGAATDLSRKGA
jgi:hypothetical protein